MLEHLCNLQEHYKKADLHIHTTASDGIFSSQEIIGMAEKAGLSYIAITDHDTVEGLFGLKQTSPNLVLIPGIEFTSDVDDKEVHILGYNIDISNTGLLEKLAAIAYYRSKRITEIISRSNHLGYKLSFEQLPVNCNSLKRSHIAASLVNQVYFTNVPEAFETLLSVDKPAYVPHYPQQPADIINLIKQAKGISVLAHPKLIKSAALIGQGYWLWYKRVWKCIILHIMRPILLNIKRLQKRMG